MKPSADGHPAQPQQIVVVDLGDLRQRPALVLPPVHDRVAVIASLSWDRASKLPVVAGASFRIPQRVPGIVDDDHLPGIAAEVRMMSPGECAIGPSDRRCIGIRVDTENGIQGRQSKTRRTCIELPPPAVTCRRSMEMRTTHSKARKQRPVRLPTLPRDLAAQRVATLWGFALGFVAKKMAMVPTVSSSTRSNESSRISISPSSVSPRLSNTPRRLFESRSLRDSHVCR